MTLDRSIYLKKIKKIFLWIFQRFFLYILKFIFVLFLTSIWNQLINLMTYFKSDLYWFYAWATSHRHLLLTISIWINHDFMLVSNGELNLAFIGILKFFFLFSQLDWNDISIFMIWSHSSELCMIWFWWLFVVFCCWAFGFEIWERHF